MCFPFLTFNDSKNRPVMFLPEEVALLEEQPMMTQEKDDAPFTCVTGTRIILKSGKERWVWASIEAVAASIRTRIYPMNTTNFMPSPTAFQLTTGASTHHE